MATSKEASPSHSVPVHKLTGAFLRAAYEGNVDQVHQMLREGVPVDTENPAGLKAIHFAAKKGCVEVVHVLLKHGAKCNVVSHKGSTPLHVAALLGKTEVVKLLLKNGADVNLRSDCNEDQFSPLYMAAQIGNQEIVTLLLAHGADPSAATKNGSTARDVAFQQGFQAVAELLQEYERRMHEGDKEQEASGAPSDKEATKPSDSGKDISEQEGKTINGAKKNGMSIMGQPPVYQDVIPSPHHSPLRTRARKQQQQAEGSSS